VLSAQGLLSGNPCFFLGAKMRTRVYVDGFNLYYGALKGAKFKWLNLVELARNMLPTDHKLDRLIYFTARSSGVLNR